MQPLIESLESRQLFSVAVDAASLAPKPQAPAIHEPVKQTAPVMFAGTSLDARQDTSEVLMTVTRTKTGFVAEVHITSADGTTGAFTLKGGESGALTFNGKLFGENVTVQAQLSSDNVTGNFTSVRKDGTINTGTFTLSRTTAPARYYAGTGTGTGTGTGNDAKAAKVAHLTAAVIPILTGYVALVRCVNPDGTIGYVTMTADASGHFIYDATDNGEQLHVDAQLSTDGKTIAGSFTSTKADNSTSGGTFTLNRT